MSAEAPSRPRDRRQWQGEYVRYDLIKELVIALGVITALAIILTILFSSPDDTPITIQSGLRPAPSDFVATAITELDGTSEIATYGPPYNHTSGDGAEDRSVSPADFAGVHQPIDTAKDFVIDPLCTIPADPASTAALAAYQAAPPAQQAAWTDAYTEALEKARFPGGGAVRCRPVDYGPVAPMMSALVGLAQSGGLDGALLTSGPASTRPTTRSRCCSSPPASYFEDRAKASTCSATSGE